MWTEQDTLHRQRAERSDMHTVAPQTLKMAGEEIANAC